MTAAWPCEGPAAADSLASPPSLAGVLRSYRAARRLPMRVAGGLVGASAAAWGKWESGVVPGPLYVDRLAGLLGLPVSEVRRLAGPDRVRRPVSVGEEQSHPLARARLRAGLSAAEFARRLHVSASLVSRWEGGQRLPARRDFAAIARVLGSDIGCVGELFGQQVAVGEWVPLPSLPALRQRRGLTRAALGRLVGVDASTAQRWEREGRAPYRQALVLAVVLRIDLPALMRPAIACSPRRPGVTPLCRLRLQRELSVGVVAARAHVPRSSLQAWERGASQPSWWQARGLAGALKVPVAQVFVATGLERPRHLDPARWSAARLPAIVAEVRRWQGWTQRDLANLTGVSVSTVRAWEQGRRRPRPAALSRLDQYLATSIQLSSLLPQVKPARLAPGAGAASERKTG